MWDWVKKLFKDEKKNKTTMVEVLKELWDINEQKEREVPPPNVQTDIYRVEARDRPVPHRDPKRRQKYKKLK